MYFRTYKCQVRLQIWCNLLGLAGENHAEGCGMEEQSLPDYICLFLPLPLWQMEVSHRNGLCQHRGR